MFKLVILIIMMSFVTLHATPLLKTGQSSSYNADGTIITDGSIKDDGYYLRGHVRSYIRDNEVVTDNVTGLEWQDNAEANSTLETHNDAKFYCQDLVLDSKGDWRVPTIQELQTLVDYSEYDASVSDGEFRYLSSNNYWSSTTHAYYTSYAWHVNFYDGFWYDYPTTSNNYVRCVRGGQFDDSNFSRSGNIVSDTTTNLQWQDNEDVATNQDNWTGSIDYCEDLTLDGRTDWRMPNYIELLSIVDFTKNKPYIDIDIFQNISSSLYWSSTTDAHYASDAWQVYFHDGRSDYYNKADSYYYVRCVRGGQFGDLEPLVTAPLLKTGQAASYGSEDDGDIQAGKTRSYSRSSNGIVTDNVTGLEWQDNVASVEKPWLTETNFDNGHHGADTTGDTATNYCLDLDLNGSGWRLPSKKEIESIVDLGESYPSVTDNIFENISSDYYWSSTTPAYGTSHAWHVGFDDGYMGYYPKLISLYVRCVRGRQLDNSTFTRDDTTKVVTDTKRNLQWQDNVNVTKAWVEAIDYCKTLSLDGSKWRLPNKTELLSIVDDSKYNAAINSVFNNVMPSNYWSSTTKDGATGDGWYIGFLNGLSYYYDKSSSYNVRCVRGGEVDSTKVNPAVIMYLLN